MKRYLLATFAATAMFASGAGAFAQSPAPDAMGAGHAMGDHMGTTGNMKMDMKPSMKTGGNVGALAASLQGKPVVAQIHADWCPVCKAERATLSELRAKYGDSIAFVELDVTNAKAADASAAKAKTLGLGAFFDAHKASTGTVAVINPKTGAVAATLYNVTDDATYAKAIDAVTKQLHA